MVDAAPRSAPQRVAPDEGQPGRQHGCTRDDRPLRAPDIGDDGVSLNMRLEIFHQLDVLPDRRGENDQVGVRHHHRVIGGHVDGMTHHRLLEHILVVDTDQQTSRPLLTRRQRDRPTDQTQANDGDPVEERTCGSGGTRLNDRKPATVLGHVDVRFPTRDAGPAPRRCSARSRVR